MIERSSITVNASASRLPRFDLCSTKHTQKGGLTHTESHKRFKRTLEVAFGHYKRLPVLSAAVGAKSAFPAPDGPGTVKELPVFPLGIVSFPTATIPLNIFEARYRVLFNTLLAGLPGIEEDLVNDQKPWCGSRLFGMCFTQPEGGMASIGVTLYILKHERLPDGRLLVINKGIEKFKILKVLEERPVLICQVEMLEDSEDSSPEVTALASKTVQLFKDLIELNVRLKKVSSMEAGIDPDLDTMSPRELSYYFGLVFQQAPALQQALLEEESLLRRISQEREVFDGTIKYLRAHAALQSAFATDTPESSQESKADSLEQKPEQSQGESQQNEEEPGSTSQ